LLSRNSRKGMRSRYIGPRLINGCACTSKQSRLLYTSFCIIGSFKFIYCRTMKSFSLLLGTTLLVSAEAHCKDPLPIPISKQPLLLLLTPSTQTSSVASSTTTKPQRHGNISAKFPLTLARAPTQTSTCSGPSKTQRPTISAAAATLRSAGRNPKPPWSKRATRWVLHRASPGRRLSSRGLTIQGLRACS
jgi:hypothetical protein